jgi:amidohydrolase
MIHQTMIERIKNHAHQLFETIRGFRHHLHQNPELSYHEYETSKFIQHQLTQWGIPFETGYADTGIVAMIHGEMPGDKVIGLRGDMDALPITEANDVPYKSKNYGVMHACGHDVHTSCLLGAARILQLEKAHFGGTVKLVFQPAEERLPGGASLMIRDGVLENPKPDFMIGQHVMPLVPVGKIGIRPGKYMASADEITLVVRGKGGHAAMPDLNVDPVLIAAHLIVAAQQLVSRMAKPSIPSVLSFGDIQGHGAFNVIPNEVTILGTFRTMDENWRSEAHEKLTKLLTGMAESMGGSCEVQINKGYPFLVNDEVLTKRIRERAVAYLGEEHVVDLDIWMAAEDFAYYSQAMPSCFYRLGTGNESKGITSSVHTPTFDIDEDALPIGMGLMAYNAIMELSS